jgi:hypothetical protein
MARAEQVKAGGIDNNNDELRAACGCDAVRECGQTAAIFESERKAVYRVGARAGCEGVFRGRGRASLGVAVWGFAVCGLSAPWAAASGMEMMDPWAFVKTADGRLRCLVRLAPKCARCQAYHGCCHGCEQGSSRSEASKTPAELGPVV